MKKKVWLGLLVVGIIVCGGLYGGVRYLYNYAIVPGEKDFLANGTKKPIDRWSFVEQTPKKLSIQSKDGLRLKARLVQQKQSEKPKLAVLAHGYGNDASKMEAYGQLFFQLGYDLLLPDARGHGTSEGEYVGFGWHERLDYLKWLQEVLRLYGKDVEIVLFGVSMGASTIMMTAGEKLPLQVQALIADCGYDTVENELSYQLREMFHLPSWPLIPLASAYTKHKVDYSFTEASAVAQLRNNQLPIMFIHGTADTFVPTEMVKPLVKATKGPKELWLVEGAEHAESLKKAPAEYRQKVASFLQRYTRND